jgi:hypothetical protein
MRAPKIAAQKSLKHHLIHSVLVLAFAMPGPPSRSFRPGSAIRVAEKRRYKPVSTFHVKNDLKWSIAAMDS